MLGENRPILIITNDTDSVMEGQKNGGLQGNKLGKQKWEAQMYPVLKFVGQNKFNEAFRIVLQ